MIPTVQDDNPPADTTAPQESEISTDPAAAPTAGHGGVENDDVAAQPTVQLSDSVIQSLVAESKPQLNHPSQSDAEIQRIGDIEAALSAQTPTGAAKGQSASNAGFPGEQPAVTAQAATTAPPAVPSNSKSQSQNAQPGPSIPPGETVANATKSAIAALSAPPQPAQVKPVQRPAGGATAAVPTINDSAAAPSTPSSPEATAASAPPDGQPAPLPTSPVPTPTLASTDPGVPRQDIESQNARTLQNGANTQTATANPATGTNTPTPNQNASATPDSATTNSTYADVGTPIEGSAHTTGTASNDATAKTPPPNSGVSATVSAPQSGAITDMAAAFGSDLRLGADGIRPAAIDQAFRGQPLQPASEQVAVQITRAVQQGADRLTINLKPASMGQISVELEVGPDNRLIAVVSAERPETLDLMQRDARALERALNDAGLKTDSGSLSFNLRGDGGNGHADGEGASDWSSFAPPEDSNKATPMPVYARTLGAEGGIDIRV
jgi:hypothetical protein